MSGDIFGDIDWAIWRRCNIRPAKWHLVAKHRFYGDTLLCSGWPADSFTEKRKKPKVGDCCAHCMRMLNRKLADDG